MARSAHPQRCSLSAMAVMVAFVLLLSLHVGTEAKQCQGRQNYTIDLKLNWSKETDRDFTRDKSVVHIVAVSHTESYELFTTSKNMSSTFRHLLQSYDLTLLFQQFEESKASSSPTVFDYIFDTSTDPQDTVRMELELDASRNMTWISLVGLLRNKPDYFFAYMAIPMCNSETGNFTDHFPQIRYSKVISYDAGFNDRKRVADSPDPISVPKLIKIDKRPSLDKHFSYALFKIRKGVFEPVKVSSPIWKICLILGLLATAFLLISAFVCLYYFCRKSTAGSSDPAAEGYTSI